MNTWPNQAAGQRLECWKAELSIEYNNVMIENFRLAKMVSILTAPTTCESTPHYKWAACHTNQGSHNSKSSYQGIKGVIRELSFC